MKYTVKNNATLLDTIMEMYRGISKQKAKQIFSHSEFIIDGEQVEKHPKLQINTGMQIELVDSAKVREKNQRPTRNNPISIYFEDEFLVVALKPAGILSCNDKSAKNIKSYHKVLESYIQKRDDNRRRIWVVHRLDKEVEGLIIFAKNEEVQTLLKENWQHVTKSYLALTEKRPPGDNGIIQNWLKEGKEQKVYAYDKEVEGSKFAKTEYQYLRKEKNYHLLELKLDTGRKNQIRAHLSGLGCPIVGDHKYGADGSVKRQIRLAAHKLEFSHPITNQTLVFEYMPISRFFNPSKNEDENYKMM